MRKNTPGNIGAGRGRERGGSARAIPNGSSVLCIREYRSNVHLYANIRVSHGRICEPEIVKRPTDAPSRIHSSTLARGPEDFVGRTMGLAVEPSSSLATEAADPCPDRSRATRRRKFHVAESTRVDRPMDRYAVTSLEVHSSLMATSPGRKCICQESD